MTSPPEPLETAKVTPPADDVASDASRKTRRRPGRPRARPSNPVPYARIDALLVEGEFVTDDLGRLILVYPSQREVARRFHVDHTTVLRYGQTHGVDARRQEASPARYAELARRRAAAGDAAPPPSPAAEPAPRTSADSDEGVAPAPHTVAEADEDAASAAHDARVATADADASPRDDVPAADASAATTPPDRAVPEVPGLAARKGPRAGDLRNPHVCAELDRMVLFGDIEIAQDGRLQARYPTTEEIARRLDVARAAVTAYVAKHKLHVRREEIARRISARVEERLVESTAAKIVMARARQLQLLDGFLVRAESDALEGQLRVESIADVNTVLRLRAFLSGEVESRQEVHTEITLDALHARHREQVRRGDVIDVEAGLVPPGQLAPAAPPTVDEPAVEARSSTEDATAEVTS
jgi:predicted transcriptional regulator